MPAGRPPSAQLAGQVVAGVVDGVVASGTSGAGPAAHCAEDEEQVEEVDVEEEELKQPAIVVTSSPGCATAGAALDWSIDSMENIRCCLGPRAAASLPECRLDLATVEEAWNACAWLRLDICLKWKSYQPNIASVHRFRAEHSEHIQQKRANFWGSSSQTTPKRAD